jgi:hypothetical protein
MNTALGCLFLAIGVCVTFNTERAIRFMRGRQLFQWQRDILDLPIYPLFCGLVVLGSSSLAL